jgi:atrazine chlorohydrolase/5-methylthioadenosine/S-adenosylhomocysteine deaminase/melamine deaminase
MNKYHGTAGGRISVWPAPGIVHFLTIDGMLGALSLAEKHDTMVSTHLAESPADAEIYGVSSTQFLAYIGYLNKRLLAGHCVWMKDRDLRILKKFDVKVSHLPVSNQFLASGIAPVARMLGFGITVSIGTDDVNCNESVNMVSDMKHVALLQKVNNLDSGAITAEKVLEMSTIDGARAIRMEDQVGSIEVGKKADIIVIDLQRPHLKPCHHIPAVLVYQANGSEIDTTIVDGKILMTGGKPTILSEAEEKKAMEDAQNASIKIAERAGMHWRRDRGWQVISV